MLQLVLNEKRQPLSAHAVIEVPDKERTRLTVRELLSTMPRLALHFDGTSIDRCIATFWTKSGKCDWLLQDAECADEVKEIFAECGYTLDPPEEPAPLVEQLAAPELERHKDMLADIREGLAHLRETK